MSEARTAGAPNLKALEDRYEILGELRSGDRVGTYIGRRRDDGADVAITIVRGASDDNNALNHFAADTQLLSKISHPDIPQVIEGRWIDKNSFAVVSERALAETLDERLARGEQYSPPLIAMVLSEVDAVLDWARTNGIVHRGVTPDTISFEPGTNRVNVVFEPTPIPLEGVPDATADARTIGRLAWAMFTGERYVEGQSLAEARPDLAARVVRDTEAIAQTPNGGDLPDVQTYIAVVAAADALRAGEMEMAETQAEMFEAQRVEVEQFDAEKKECAARNSELEEQLANERKEFERRMAEEEAELAALKAEFADYRQKEEGQLAAERAQFEAERATLARERTEFDERVAEGEADLAAKHADVDRIRAEEGRRIDAAIAAAVQTVLDTTAAAPASVEAVEAAHERVPEPAPRSKAKKIASLIPVSIPVAAQKKSKAPEPWVSDMVKQHSVGDGQPVAPVSTGSGHRPGWLIPVGAAAVIVVLLIIFAVTDHGSPSAQRKLQLGKSTIVPTAPTTDIRGTPRGGFLTQTAGGNVAPSASGAPLAPGATPGATAPGATAATALNAATPTGATRSAVSDSAAAASRRKTTPTSSTDNAAQRRKAKAAAQHAADISTPSGGAYSAEAEAIREAEEARQAAAARSDSAAQSSAPSAAPTPAVPPIRTVPNVPGMPSTTPQQAPVPVVHDTAVVRDTVVVPRPDTTGVAGRGQ